MFFESAFKPIDFILILYLFIIFHPIIYYFPSHFSYNNNGRKSLQISLSTEMDIRFKWISKGSIYILFSRYCYYHYYARKKYIYKR